MKLQKIISHSLIFFLGFQLLSQSYFSYALSPSDISNQVFHFDAQNLDGDNTFSTQPVDNSRISELLDLANSHTGSQTDINKQSQFQLTGLNSRPGLFFDGVNDIYTVEDSLDIGSNLEYAEKSFSVVFQTGNDINTFQTIYEQGGQEKGYGIQIDSGKLFVGVWNTIDWSIGNQFKIADLGELETNTVYNIIISQDSNIANNLQIYQNGSLISNIFSVAKQSTHGTCIISGSFNCYLFANGGSIGIGATKNDTLQLSNETGISGDELHHFSGYIGELLSWNSKLTTAEALGLFTYFDDKWGIKGTDITFENPGKTGVIQPGDFEIDISYNDYQNGSGVIITSDDIQLFELNGTATGTNVTATYINSLGKDITKYEATFPVVGIVQGKYRLQFSITKNNGIVSTQTRDFYVGELSPDLLPNGVFHYDVQDINGDDINNNPVDNSGIQTLVDKFNGYNAIQNSAAIRPILENNSIFGNPSISFNGSSQYFDIGNQTIINTRTNPRFTEKSFAIVFKTGNDINTFQTVYEQGGNARGYSFVVDNGSVYAGVWNTSEWDIGHQFKSVNLGPAQANTTYFAMVVQDSQTADDSLNTLKIYLNGNLASVQDHVDSQNGHPGTISIGRVNGNTVSASTNTVINTSGSFFNGNIGELISWNHALDQAEVNGVQEYFSQRWGIVLFSETYPIPSPTSDTTPAYTFTSNRAGSLTYSGSCSSTTSNAIIGENIINFSADTLGNPLANGLYNDCTIQLLDGFGNTHVLNVSSFEVQDGGFTLTEITPVVSGQSNNFPQYTFSSPISGTIEYSGSCSSNTSFANIGNNTITFNYLSDGTYSNCFIRVINGTQQSEFLLVSTFTIISTSPVFSGSNIGNNDVIPVGTYPLIINYSDAGTIDVNSENIVLQKYDSLSSSWGGNLKIKHLTEVSITSTQATYTSNINTYGKYRLQFTISNTGGVSATYEIIFYIDKPELIVSRGTIDLGGLSADSVNYSTPIQIEVKTLGAGFNILLKKENQLTNGTETIQDYDGNYGYGYQNDPYSSPIEVITSTEIIGTQSKNVNINGEKNTYIYNIRLGAIIDELQVAGNYNGNIQFGIQLQYD